MLKAHIVPVTAFSQNCSLIWCDETMEGALVDPGGDVEKILAKVQEKGVNVTQILLTHGHLDHAGGAKDLKAEYKEKGESLPIVGPHTADRFWLEQIEDNADRYGLTGLKNCEPDQWLDDGDTVKLGNLELQVLHCPGHTPGHLVFFEPQSKIAFVGDVLFKGSIGRTDFPRGHHASLISSITEKLWPLGDDVTFVPGHGDLSTFGDERRNNPFVGDQALKAS